MQFKQIKQAINDTIDDTIDDEMLEQGLCWFFISTEKLQVYAVIVGLIPAERGAF